VKELILGFSAGCVATGLLVYKERYRLVLGIDLTSEYGEEIATSAICLAMIYYKRGYLVLDNGGSILSWGSGEIVLTH
jgi:hypothetical protein